MSPHGPKRTFATRSFNVRWNSGDWPDFEGETLKTVFPLVRSRFSLAVSAGQQSRLQLMRLRDETLHRTP